MASRAHEQYSIPVRGYDLDDETLPALLRQVADWLEAGPAHLDHVKDIALSSDGLIWFATVYYSEVPDGGC